MKQVANPTISELQEQLDYIESEINSLLDEKRKHRRLEPEDHEDMTEEWQLQLEINEELSALKEEAFRLKKEIKDLKRQSA